jgi:hypothetical protein
MRYDVTPKKLTRVFPGKPIPKQQLRGPLPVKVSKPKSNKSILVVSQKVTPSSPLEVPMEFPKEALKTLEIDAKDAAFRLAGRQFVKLTREPLVAFLAGHLGQDDPSMRARVGAFLDTELGEALVATLLSLGLSMLPETAGELPQRLARELRVKAMTDVGDVVADLLMSPLRQVITDFLRGEQAPALPIQSAHIVPFPQVELSPQEATIPAQQKASSK